MRLNLSSKLLVGAVVATVSTGFLFTWIIAADLDRSAESNLMAQANIVASSINFDRLKKLTGSESDLALQDYSRLKKQLYDIRFSNETCRFLYILGYDKSNQNVFFFVDSQLPDSEDYAPPGLIYEEVTDKFRAAVSSGVEAFVGPVSDRWGTLVTALIPLKDPETDEVIATLGMDVEADDWRAHLFKLSAIPVGMTLLTTVLIVLAVVLKLKSNELRKTVTLDSLTKLYSRKIILERAEIELYKCLQGGDPFSLIVLDVDDFKQVNDRCGHQCGDAVLREIAACFTRVIRKTDLAGRVGGEEFMVLLPKTSEQNAVDVAEKIRQSIEEIEFDRKQFKNLSSISASFGVSTVSGKIISFDRLYEQADKALYLSKNKGKNKVSVYID